MSALPPKFGTILMSALCQKRTNPWFALFDHLVGKREQVRRPRETERFHGLDIDHQFELGWLHHWQIRRLLPFEDAASVTAELMICLGKVSTVTHQTARRGELAEFVYRGNRILCGERYERFALRVMIGSAGCCARTASGQVVALLPTNAMNSRRLIRLPRRHAVGWMKAHPGPVPSRS